MKIGYDQDAQVVYIRIGKYEFGFCYATRHIYYWHDAD